MSLNQSSLSPGRRRAMALSGSRIQSDTQHAAPDGHPVGPGAQAASQVEKPLLGSTKPASERRLPFTKRSK